MIYVLFGVWGIVACVRMLPLVGIIIVLLYTSFLIVYVILDCFVCVMIPCDVLWWLVNLGFVICWLFKFAGVRLLCWCFDMVWIMFVCVLFVYVSCFDFFWFYVVDCLFICCLLSCLGWFVYVILVWFCWFSVLGYCCCLRYWTVCVL